MTTEPDDAGGAEPRELAMFPLGSVLLPGMALPLRIFEPRYRRMFGELLDAAEPRFGVVLIERGSEVGGGDVRTDVGCVAEIRGHESAPDGQIAVVAEGVHRIRVVRWLPEDPYPRALVTAWADDLPAATPTFAAAIAELDDEVFEVAGLTVELLGGRLPHRDALSNDPERRVYELATLAPLGPLDRQRVLTAPGLGERVALLAELVREQRLLLRARFES